jgi:hypothetical protein
MAISWPKPLDAAAMNQTGLSVAIVVGGVSVRVQVRFYGKVFDGRKR